MRLTKNQLKDMITYILNTLDNEDARWLLTIINLNTISLFEFNRMKKIMPLNISEDMMIVDEFNIREDSAVKKDVDIMINSYLKLIEIPDLYEEQIAEKKIIELWVNHFKTDTLNGDKIININDISKDIVPKICNYFYDDKRTYYSLTIWHYIFNNDDVIFRDIIIIAIYNYIKFGYINHVPFLRNKGNGYEFMVPDFKSKPINDVSEFMIAMNFLINNGVISWR